MAHHCILCIESDPKSLQSLQWALNPFAKKFCTRFVKDEHQARVEIADIKAQGKHLAMIIASQSETTQAAELLVELEHSQDKCRKVLVCDPTQLASILTAVNDGRLDHCFTKPLEIDEAINIIRKELTSYILDTPKLDWLGFGSILDSQRIIRRTSTAASMTIAKILSRTTTPSMTKSFRKRCAPPLKNSFPRVTKQGLYANTPLLTCLPVKEKATSSCGLLPKAR
ncbi:sensor histidine kinase [Vibrio ishigakensis]|uniref:Sensor histidine kinase n=1 Tax=Vibrio ishigakensis TaxID=1481914 RepID=A0A0B8P172_9VIBR|nr:sensor histidine kinase [Vibrio ishigakensis]